MGVRDSFRVPLPAKPKARPRRKGKHTFMPKAYMDWKEAFGFLANAKSSHSFTGRVTIDLAFAKDGVTIRIEEADTPRYGNADLDNLIGGVLDALQDAGIIRDDKDVVSLAARFDI